MGKNQHSKDRLFITASEWKSFYGGKKEGTGRVFKRLPFDCCALTFRPFADPVCTRNGDVFDLVAVVPFIKKHGYDPVTGEKLRTKDLIKLHFAKNKQGKYHCPVTFKEFTDNSNIVAVRTSGNVYSYEAVKELNIKAKNWSDLVDGTPFVRKDLIRLQDPENFHARDMRKFAHVARQDADPVGASGGTRDIRLNAATKRVFDEIASKAAASAGAQARKRRKPGPGGAAKSAHSSGRAAMSFTSTAVDVHTKHELADATEDELAARRYKRVRSLGKKGYVRLTTSVGDLNLELHCNLVPRTCENFMGLAKRGYYDGTGFHRIIRNFCIQGGDPTGTGKGGESLWGGTFKDEFDSKLTHDGRGVLSMANSGKHTNKSQFFVTLKSCHHLDNVHTVFGRLVGGEAALRALETIPTDAKDRPKQEARIIKAQVFVDPFAMVDDKLAKEKKGAGASSAAGAAKDDAEDWTAHTGAWSTHPLLQRHRPVATGTGVGKYMTAATKKRVKKTAATAKGGGRAGGAAADKINHGGSITMLTSKSSQHRKRPKKTSFAGFSNW